jgi:hypothetical protein
MGIRWGFIPAGNGGGEEMSPTGWFGAKGSQGDPWRRNPLVIQNWIAKGFLPHGSFWDPLPPNQPYKCSWASPRRIFFCRGNGFGELKSDGEFPVAIPTQKNWGASSAPATTKCESPKRNHGSPVLSTCPKTRCCGHGPWWIDNCIA